MSAQAAPTETSAVRRCGVTAEGYGSADGGVQRPAVGDALELVLSALLERDARAGTRSRTVRVTSTSSGAARSETRAPM